MYEIRPVELSDTARFLRLEARCFGMRYSANTLYYWRPILDYCWAFKAVHRHKIVGGVIAMPTRQGLLYINSLFVHPQMRRLGIGSKLLDVILELPSSGFILDVKSDKMTLIKMYRRCGFKVTKKVRNYYLDGTERTIMQRKS